MKMAQKWLAPLLISALLCCQCAAALAEDEMDTMGGMTLKTFVKKFGVALKTAYALKGFMKMRPAWQKKYALKALSSAGT